MSRLQSIKVKLAWNLGVIEEMFYQGKSEIQGYNIVPSIAFLSFSNTRMGACMHARECVCCTFLGLVFQKYVNK